MKNLKKRICMLTITTSLLLGISQNSFAVIGFVTLNPLLIVPGFVSLGIAVYSQKQVNQGQSAFKFPAIMFGLAGLVMLDANQQLNFQDLPPNLDVPPDTRENWQEDRATLNALMESVESEDFLAEVEDCDQIHDSTKNLLL